MTKDNVIFMFQWKSEQLQKELPVEEAIAPVTTDFTDQESKNRQNQERLRKERARDNKSVLRNYRIKEPNK